MNELDFQQFSEVDGWFERQKDLEEPLLRIIGLISEKEGFSWGWLNVILLPSNKHKELNIKYLNHDYATDVLTFPFDDGEHISGEIYVDEEVLKQQADSYRCSLEQEYVRLVIHGALHLAGYDDGSEAEKDQMSRLENEYMSREGFM